MTAKIYPFNDRAQGIFANGYTDLYGQPVGDTAAARFRHRVKGAESKDMSHEDMAALIASYTSEQIDLVLSAPPALPGQRVQAQTLEEFKNDDRIVLGWLENLSVDHRHALVCMAIDRGYRFEEQSILVDVLAVAQTVPVAIFHEHDGQTAEAVALLEQWCDEEVRQRESVACSDAPCN